MTRHEQSDYEAYKNMQNAVDQFVANIGDLPDHCTLDDASVENFQEWLPGALDRVASGEMTKEQASQQAGEWFVGQER